jgi:uncharacterized protein
MLRARVSAPPADGAANEALLRLLARELRVPRSAVELLRGATVRAKTVRVTGADGTALRRRWPDLRVS